MKTFRVTVQQRVVQEVSVDVRAASAEGAMKRAEVIAKGGKNTHDGVLWEAEDVPDGVEYKSVDAEEM